MKTSFEETLVADNRRESVALRSMQNRIRMGSKFHRIVRRLSLIGATRRSVANYELPRRSMRTRATIYV